MPELIRLTAEYIPSEDRIRLSGATAGGDTVVLWLTRRLIERMLPQLFGWLEGQGQAVSRESARQTSGGLPKELLNTFAQQAARTRAKPEPPVRAAADSQSWLVQSLDLRREPRGISLAFKHPSGGAPGPAVVRLPAAAVRQWLNVLHDQYRRAGWPMDVWPTWVTEAGPTPRAKVGSVH